MLAVAAGCASKKTPTETETATISVSLTPTSAAVEQGSSTDVDVTVTGGGGFSGSAAISLQSAPSGVTGTVSNLQSSDGNTSATLTIAVAASVAPDDYDLTVRATGSGVSPDEATFALTVTAAPSYQLSATPSQITVEQGGEGTTDIGITRTNFSGDVTLAVEGTPSGMTASFDTNPVSGNTAALTVAADGTVAADTYTLTIRGTATGLSDRTIDVDVTVTAPGTPAYTLGVDPSSLTVDQGGSGDVDITVTRSNFTGSVTLSAEGLPTGVSASFSTNPVTGDASTMTVSAGGSAAAGDYTFTLRGTATGLSDRTASVDLTVANAPAYSLSLSPTSITIEQSASGTVDVTLTRTNFTEAVDLSLENAPSGVTGTFSVDPVTGDASVLTIDVGASVTADDYMLTVRGTSASLADETATLTLTVSQPAGGFSLGSISPLSVVQGASGVRTVTINRTGGFTGDVTVTVTGLATGITASVDPVTTAGTSVDVTINVAGTVSVGDYTAMVRGNATGQPESIQTLDISVTSSAGQDVSLDFSVCGVDQRPIWLAYQDGDGPWTPVSGVGDTYTFKVASSKAGVAITTIPGTGHSSVFVLYATQAELVTGDLEDLCDPVPAGKTVNATVSGINFVNLEEATIALGDAVVRTSFDGAVTFYDVPSGNLDLVGFKGSQNDATDRMIFMRDLDPADGGNIGTIDFATNGFDPITGTITLQGGTGSGTWETEYATSPSAGVCYYAPLQFDFLSGSQFTARGAPADRQQSGDFHVVTATNATGSVSETFAALANRTISFGEALPTPTITDITDGGAYRRVRAELTLPAEYNSIVSIGVTDTFGAHGIATLATSAWLGGLSVSLEIPDFSGLSGWSDAWAPTSSSTSNWGLTGTGGTGDDCTEGARWVTSVVSGTVG